MLEAFMMLGSLVGMTVIGCLAAKLGQLHERRKWERRLVEHAGFRFDEFTPAPAVSLGAAQPDRLERLEQAVEAIAIETERISEGQRFVTKLLAERSVDRPLRSPRPGEVKSISRPTA